MEERCILGMASSSARHPILPLANERVQPGKAEFEKLLVVPTLERDLLAKDQGEKIWHEENPQCRIHPLLEWLQD